MRMKNNKGFSLIELLVALAVLAIVMGEIGTLVLNCSSLYKRGTLETSMQGDAQRATQIIEELLVDADIKVQVGTNDAFGNNDITIDKSDGNYVVRLDYDATKGYGKLLVNSEVIADYVKSIHFLNDEYNTSDRITVQIEMYNGYSKYGDLSGGGLVTKDFYIRNELGTSGNKATNSSSENDCELEILRYQEYDLAEIFNRPEEGLAYTFEFSGGSTALVSMYSLTGSVVKPLDAVNKFFNKGETETETWIDAKRDGELAFKIKLYSVPVEVAMCKEVGKSPMSPLDTKNGEYYCFANMDTAQTQIDTYINVKGISLTAEAVGYDKTTTADGAGHIHVSIDAVGNPSYNKNVCTNSTLKNVPGQWNYNLPHWCRAENCYMFVDEERNAIVIHTKLMSFENKSDLTAFYSDKDNKMKISFDVLYQSPGAHLTADVYLIPTGMNGGDTINLVDTYFDNIDYDKKTDSY